MDHRVDVTSRELTDALRLIADGLQKRLEEKGGKSFISLHEVDGALDEEVSEWKMEVHSKDRKAAILELIDVGVTSAFGIASLNAITRCEAASKPAPPARA